MSKKKRRRSPKKISTSPKDLPKLVGLSVETPQDETDVVSEEEGDAKGGHSHSRNQRKTVRQHHRGGNRGGAA